MKLNLKSLVDKKFEKFSRWEQREIYSYHDINEQDTNLELVTTPELKTKIRFDFKLAKLLHYKNTFLTISAIAGLVYFKFDLLGWALLVAWVVSNLLFLNLHENWVHGYIQAKNKFLDIILDSTTYFFYTKLPIIEKIDINNSYTDHLLHHKYSNWSYQ